MRLALLASLATLAQAPMFATCGRAPATGVTYDCPDGRAFTVAFTDSSTAVLTLDRETWRLASATRGGPRWTDSTRALTLATTGDTATVQRGDSTLRQGCVVRNPELRRGA